MAMTVKVEGLRELERNLEQLTKAAGKGALRRAGLKSLKPMAELMRDYAPRGTTASDDLAESIMAGTKLSARQAGLHRKMFRDERSSVEMFAGPGPDPAAHNQEFGNINHGPQPFVRPAWDQDKDALLQRIRMELKSEIDKAVARMIRKQARAR